MNPLPGAQDFRSPQLEAYRERQKVLRQLRKLEEAGNREAADKLINDHLPLLAALPKQNEIELSQASRAFLLTEIQRKVTDGESGDTTGTSSGGGSGTAKAVVSSVAQQQQQKGGHGGQGMAPK